MNGLKQSRLEQVRREEFSISHRAKHLNNNNNSNQVKVSHVIIFLIFKRELESIFQLF